MSRACHPRYKAGCPECQEKQRARVAKSRATRRAAGVCNGNRSSYDAGCRCDDCLRARADAYARLERR